MKKYLFSFLFILVGLQLIANDKIEKNDRKNTKNMYLIYKRNS